jgi:hypothetical protein
MWVGIDKQGAEIREGDRVTHPRYGAGVVSRPVGPRYVRVCGEAELFHCLPSELESVTLSA